MFIILILFVSFFILIPCFVPKLLSLFIAITLPTIETAILVALESTSIRFHAIITIVRTDEKTTI